MPSTTDRAIAFIFARGGSKGVPRKNIKPLNGIPLIAYSIKTALATPEIESVIVSTDDAEIAAVAAAWGAQVPFLRPAELAQDTSPEWLAWRHAITWTQQNTGPFDLFVSLPATAPFREVGDVQRAMARLKQDADTDVVITVTQADHSPYFNMVSLDANNHASILIPPGKNVARRQDAPVAYNITTVAYVTRPAFVLSQDGIFSGNVGVVQVPAERALDIDTLYDFEIAQALLQARQGSGVSAPS